MKHHPSILKKIRKLLRLAASPGPEGERAAERAKDLMERHGIDEVTLDQRVRVTVHGVQGELWREQVLLTVAQATGCALLENKTGDATRAALQGERQDVEVALSAYHRLVLEISRQCWEQFALSAPECPKGHIAERVWAVVFHTGAATSLGESVADAIARARKERDKNGKGLDIPEDAPTVDMTPPEEPKDDITKEKIDRARNSFEKDLFELARRIGPEKAELLRDIAFRTSVERGKRLILVERPALPQDGHAPKWEVDSSVKVRFRLEQHGDPAVGFMLASEVV